MYLTVYVNNVTPTCFLVLKEQLGRTFFTVYAKLQHYKILNQTASHLTGVTSHTVRRSFVTWRGYNVKFAENSLGDLADARTWGSKFVLHLHTHTHTHTHTHIHKKSSENQKLVDCACECITFYCRYK